MLQWIEYDRGKPGWERSRMICTLSILAWQGSVLGIDWNDDYSCRWLYLADMPQREREWDRILMLFHKKNKLFKCYFVSNESCIDYIQQNDVVDMRTLLVDLVFITRPASASDALKFAFHVSNLSLWLQNS